MCLEDLDDVDSAEGEAQLEQAWPKVPYRTPRFLQPGLQLTATATEGGAGPPKGVLVVEDFPVTYEGYTYPHGKIAYLWGMGPKPVVMIHPNYAGAKKFDTDQACFLARCGYVGVVVDHYRETNLVGGNPGVDYPYHLRDPTRDLHHTLEAKKFHINTVEPPVNAGQPSIAKDHLKASQNAMHGLLSEPKHWRGLMRANLDQAFTHPAVQSGKAAAIGYCFGGQACLEQVRNGDPLQAVVTFHGLLKSCPAKRDPKRGWAFDRLTQAEYAKECNPPPNNYTTTCKVLIENGDLDTGISGAGDLDAAQGIDAWKQEMDAAGIDWRFDNHARTPHGFALPAGVFSTAYHELADRRSTLAMLSLFQEVWPEFEQNKVPCNAAGTVLGQAIAKL